MIEIQQASEHFNIYIDQEFKGQFEVEENELELNGIYYKLQNSTVYNLFTHTVIGSLHDSMDNHKAAIKHLATDQQAMIILKQIIKK